MTPGYDPRRYPPPGPYGAPPGYPAYPQPGYPYASPATEAQDLAHLNMLALFHFLYAGLLGLIGLFFVIYIVIGVAMVASPPAASGGPPPEAIGGIFALIGALAMFFTWGKAALVIWSGVSLRAHRRLTLSYVVAGLTCMNVPIGTALGIATIIALNRPSVKALYQETAPRL